MLSSSSSINRSNMFSSQKNLPVVAYLLSSSSPQSSRPPTYHHHDIWSYQHIIIVMADDFSLSWPLYISTGCRWAWMQWRRWWWPSSSSSSSSTPSSSSSSSSTPSSLSSSSSGEPVCSEEGDFIEPPAELPRQPQRHSCGECLEHVITATSLIKPDTPQRPTYTPRLFRHPKSQQKQSSDFS